MIYKRVAARLRAQDWLAIVIELGIVILGVFIGTWVANWNQERAAKAETRRMIVQLGPSLSQMTDFYRAARQYYATTRAYATTAIAGWRGDQAVGDADFVIAAYQASQTFALGTDSSTWSAILGADQLRNIDDPQMRTDLSFIMSADYSQIERPLDTAYRQNVRRIIPVEIQDAIRARCGDRHRPDRPSILILPPSCAIAIAPADAARAAALLRAHPELLADLQWHIAAVAAFLDNIVPFEAAAKRVERASRGNSR
ncbi:MAG: hypothetical protein ABIW16_04740 [Sphingomicrobium sp.]